MSQICHQQTEAADKHLGRNEKRLPAAHKRYNTPFEGQDLTHLAKQHAWRAAPLFSEAFAWFNKKRREMRRVSPNSAWWGFVLPFHEKLPSVVQQFINGSYRFSPIKAYHFSDETVWTWEYQDRMALHLLWQIIRPVAKKIIHPRSYFFNGGCRACLRDIEKTLKHQKF